MNRETQFAVGKVNDFVRALSGRDRHENDNDDEVDRVVMQLASEKLKDSVEEGTETRPLRADLAFGLGHFEGDATPFDAR